MGIGHLPWGGSFDNYFNPAAGAGVYYYIVQEGSCGPDSVAVTISITDQLLFNYGGTSRNVQDVYLCPGDTVVWAANTSVLQSWEWSVGNPTATQIMISTPGVYNLLAYDINGCEYYYRTRFKYPDWEDWSGQGPYLMTDTVTRCAGTTLGFFGNSVSTNTIICATVPSTSDCDFTHCRTFRFLPDIEVRDTVSICAGTNYTWYNQPYTQAGTYSYLIPSEVNTCDTLALLALNVYPTYERNFVVNLPPGSSFTVGDSVLTQAGLYSILLATTQGCDSLINVEVEVATELDELQSAQCLIPNLLQKGQAPWQIICPYGVRLVEWELYDVHGRKIVAEVQPAATLVLLNEQAQARLSAGVYFYHLVLEEGGISRHKTGKVVFLE